MSTNIFKDGGGTKAPAPSLQWFHKEPRYPKLDYVCDGLVNVHYKDIGLIGASMIDFDANDTMKVLKEPSFTLTGLKPDCGLFEILKMDMVVRSFLVKSDMCKQVEDALCELDPDDVDDEMIETIVQTKMNPGNDAVLEIRPNGRPVLVPIRWFLNTDDDSDTKEVTPN